MLTVNGEMKFFFLPTFTDMRCKHNRVIGIIREQLHREPLEGDVFMVMSGDRRTVRLFAFEGPSVSLYEKKFKKGYRFMKMVMEDDRCHYRIQWKDVQLLLGNPVVNELIIK